MSSHEFDRRYRLLKVVAQADGVRTHNAQEITTGRVVMVHLLDDAGPDVVESMRRRLGRLPVTEKTRVLETATLPAGFAVVTDFIPGLQSFSDWLASRDGGDAAITAEAPVADHADRDTDASPPQALEFTVGGSGPPGEFTRLFMASGRLNLETTPAPSTTPVPPPSVAVPAAALPTPAPAPAPAPAAAVAASPAPGSFTQLFGLAATPAVVPPVVPPVPPPAPAEPAPAAVPAPSLEPGEFTRMFQAGTPAPLAGASASPLVAPPRASGPESVAPSTAPSAFPPMPLPGPAFAAAPTSRPPSGPVPPLQASATGAMAARAPAFGTHPASGGADPLAAFGGAAPGSGGGAGAGFGAPAPAAPASSPPPAAPFAASPVLVPMLTPPAFRMPGTAASGDANARPFGSGTGAIAAGGSEYTRMIRQSTTPPPPTGAPTPPTPARAPAPPKTPIPVALIVAINVVLLLAVGLVLYFVLRPKPPAAVQGAVPTAPLPGAAAPATAPSTAPPTAR